MEKFHYAKQNWRKTICNRAITSFRGMGGAAYTTDEIAKVTCKNCLKTLGRGGL